MCAEGQTLSHSSILCGSLVKDWLREHENDGCCTFSLFVVLENYIYEHTACICTDKHDSTTSSPCPVCLCQIAMLTRPGAIQLILMLWGAYVAEAPIVRPATAPFAAAMASWFATPVCATALSGTESEPI